MSHFTVLVVGNTPLETAFAPFCEQTEDPRYRIFKDTSEEGHKEYETKAVTRIRRDSDGVTFYSWDEQFRNPAREKHAIFSDEPEFIIPEGFTEVEVPLKEIYETFEEFMVDYRGEEPNAEGLYGYYTNPNSKWDWYQIGGRWAGFFRIKESARSKYADSEPNFSWGWDETSKERVLNGSVLRVDQAYKGDIDFETPMNEAEAEARRIYAVFEPAIKDLPLIELWSDFIQKVESKEMNWDEAREKYHAQPRIKAISDVKNAYRSDETPEGKAIFWFDNEEELNLSLEDYVQKARDRANSTFAVLKDGKWFERGNMGWFGCVSDAKDPETWNSIFANVIKDLPDDTLLTLVDCHI